MPIESVGAGPVQIHIYEYEPLSWREYSLEAHLNFVGQGTMFSSGSLLPTTHQTHLTLEPTSAFPRTSPSALCSSTPGSRAIRLNSRAGRSCRISTRRRGWHLRFRLGFVSEFSFQSTRYEENSRRVELRPILDREFARWQIISSGLRARPSRPRHPPRLEHRTSGAAAPQAQSISPSVEIYGEVESINVSTPRDRKIHQLFFGGDWHATEIFGINIDQRGSRTARAPAWSSRAVSNGTGTGHRRITIGW